MSGVDAVSQRTVELRKRLLEKNRTIRTGQFAAGLSSAGASKRDLFFDLMKQLNQNSAALMHLSETVEKQQAKPEAEPESDDEDDERHNERVRVQVRCTFQKIFDVNTVQEQFVAEVILQAKWEEPALLEHDQSLDDLTQEELASMWDPKLIVTNIDGELMEDHVWRQALRASSTPGSGKTPYMQYRRKMKGTFKEIMELEHFPVDVQELTAQVSTERPDYQVELVEDLWELSSVNFDAFVDFGEWSLYSHVETEMGSREPTEVQAAKRSLQAGRIKHPKLDIMCHVARKPGFFFWNVTLIMFIITTLTFTTFSMEPAQVSSRVLLTLTLLLTAVAFKFVVTSRLPVISYLTYLDIYVLASILFLSLQAVQQAGVRYFIDQGDEGMPNLIEKITLIFMLVVYVGFHIGAGIYLYRTAWKKRQIMNDKDKIYHERKSRREKYLYAREIGPSLLDLKEFQEDRH